MKPTAFLDCGCSLRLVTHATQFVLNAVSLMWSSAILLISIRTAAPHRQTSDKMEHLCRNCVQTMTGNRKIRMVQLRASSAAKRSFPHHLFNSLHLRCLRHILGLHCRDRAPFSSVLETTDLWTNSVFLRPARCLWPRNPCIDYLAAWQCPFIDGSVLCGNSHFVLWLCQECRCELSCIFYLIWESRIFELIKSFNMVMFA